MSLVETFIKCKVSDELYLLYDIIIMVSLVISQLLLFVLLVSHQDKHMLDL